MNTPFIIQNLSQNNTLIQNLVARATQTQATWRPSPADWSLLEVINHLADEETEDFRTRLDLILNNPAQTWPPIDPEAWVTERHYNTRDLSQSLTRFTNARKNSISWLLSLENPAWTQSAATPWGGIMTADTLLAAWLAHDWHHIRQLTELHYTHLVKMINTVPLVQAYSGQW